MEENTVPNEYSSTQLLGFFKSIKRLYWQKKITIILWSFLFGIVGLVYAWVIKPIYTAELTFVAENDGNSKMNSYAGIAAQFGIDIGDAGGGAFVGDNINEIMKSRLLIEKTLLKVSSTHPQKTLIDLYIQNNNVKIDDNLKGKSFINYASGQNRYQDSLIKKAVEKIRKKNLEINRIDKKLNIVSIKFSDVDEYFAKHFVELLVNEAVTYYTTYKVSKTSQNVAILQKQADSLKNILRGGITEVAMQNDLNVNPTKQIVKVGVQKKQVDVQVSTALYTEILKNLELSKVALRKETPLVQIIDKPIFPLDKKKNGRLLTAIVFSFLGFLLTCILLLVKKLFKI